MQTIQTEVMLLSWAETSNGGAKIVLQLPDPSELEPFKAMTLAKGKIAGQRLAAVFVPIDEVERPVEEPRPEHRKPGPLCQLAVMWCRDPAFLQWAGRSSMLIESVGGDYRPMTEQEAKAWILDLCRIGSRRELDTVESAKATFQRAIRDPYMAWLDGAAT